MYPGHGANLPTTANKQVAAHYDDPTTARGCPPSYKTIAATMVICAIVRIYTQF